VAVIDQTFALRDRGIRFDGPTTVAALWVRNHGSMNHRLTELADRVQRLAHEFDDRLLLLTNLDGEEAVRAIRGHALLPDDEGGHSVGLTAGNVLMADHRQVLVLGAREIGATLDRTPQLRAALPSVLGLRDLEPLIDPAVRKRSSLDVRGAQELARVFWPTRAYERSRSVLARHGFVVLTGPPEMGKTAIAQMLALAQLTGGWEAHECLDPQQVLRAFDSTRPQVFVADDAFGSTEYRPDAADRWAVGLGRLLTMLDPHHWLIWTSRPAPLKAGLRRIHRERGAERFPAPAEVLVDASDLDLSEKTVILFRHAKAHGASATTRRLLRSAALPIVEHPHFTPERIRRFVGERLEELPRHEAGGEAQLQALVERELAAPTEAMRTSFHALAPEHRELLISLLDAPAGLIDERELAATVRRHHTGGLSRPPAELIDRLTDHFLRVTPLGIGWVHPSWRDLVIDELSADPEARARFLRVCGTDGITLALSYAGGRTGRRRLPLLHTDADWDLIGDRLWALVPELDDHDLGRIMLAFESMLSSGTDGAQAGEAEGLAVELLDATRRTWDRRCQPLPLFLLEAWYALRASAGADAEPPQLGRTWAELHPGSLLLARPDRAELARADEWLALAQTLARYDRPALEAFQFFQRDCALLEQLIHTLAGTAFDESLRPCVESALTRIEEVLPELSGSAHNAIEIAEVAEDIDRQLWWVPEDIAMPPSMEPVASKLGEFKREDVDRVLRDL
jgi:hypothetical protein